MMPSDMDDMAIQEPYLDWISCRAMPDELLDLLRHMDGNTRRDCFYRSLSFGTGGLRGKLGAGPNRMNLFTVRRATLGLADYLLRTEKEPSCAVSYDSRIHSRDFALLASAVLAEKGVRVYVFETLEPTPMLSFAVRHHSASAGIMITASHNPAEYNGYKVYGADGCQITLNAASEIQSCIDRSELLTDSLPSFSRQLRSGRISWIPDATIEAYYQSVLKLRTGKAGVPVHAVYSPLNGTGSIPVREVLGRMGSVRIDVVKEQEKPDGCFPTCPCPNPEIPAAMELAIRETLRTSADICFATDPDCDRMGAGVRVGESVRLISGNDMGILMLDYLCRNKNITEALPPVVIKTIVTTDMASAVCGKYGVELRNVLTGFKFIGEQIGLLESQSQSGRFLFGFEESCGYLSGTDVRDKDAVNAAMLLCDMASEQKSRGRTLVDRLTELQDEFGLYAQRLLTYHYEGEDGAGKMRGIMENLRGPLSGFAAPEFRSAVRKDYLYGDTGLPKSDVIEFCFQGGSRLVVRPSGTEPKMKAYLFVRAADPGRAGFCLDHLQVLADSLCKP